MKKFGKISLVLIIISLFSFGNTTVLVVGADRYEYEDASQKIYEQIESFTFVYSSTTLNYSIIFAAMFVEYDDDHSQLVSDVFVTTLTGYYVTMLTATLTFNASFLYGPAWNNHSGVGVDTSSIMQTSDLLYNYTIHSFIITNDLFPVNLFVVFEYTLTSSLFSEGGTYMTNNTFTLKSPKSEPEIPGYMISVLLTTITVGVLIIVVFYKKKEQRFR